MNDCLISIDGKCAHLEEHVPINGGYADLCCAYSKISNKRGLHIAHFPECKYENCPILHPELMKEWEE